MSPLIILTSLSCLILGLYAVKRFLSGHQNHDNLPFPPGPPGLPIVKNLFDWPTSREWDTYTQWGKTYGDVVHANVAGKHMIVLNSYEAATSILNHRGSLYSGRPSMYFSDEIAGFKHFTPNLKDTGSVWKEQRRVLAQHIGSKASLARFMPTATTNARRFVQHITKDSRSDTLFESIRTLVAKLILDVTYGYNVSASQDPLVNLAEKVMDDGSKASRPGVYLVDFIHFLARIPPWLPGATFKREGAVMRSRIEELLEKPYKFTQNNITKQRVQNSLVARHLQDNILSAEEEYSLKWSAGTLYAAGVDTTVSVIQFFFLYMTLYPEIQAKAQAEIDTIIGHDRLPTVSDREHLPYVQALLLEVYRYGIVLPQALPHTLTSGDDRYDGYFIPKGSIVIPHVWAMSRDSRSYRDPETFDPSRFLGDKPELDPRSYIFGFGRRICAGNLLADSKIFLTCTIILATTIIKKAIDTNGVEIVPSADFHGELVTHPKSFVCDIKLRSAHTEALLKADGDD